MTLGREDLLQKRHRHKLHENTVLGSGYIAWTQNDKSVMNIVLFYGDVRIKGYVSIKDLHNFLDRKSSIATVKKSFPREG